MKIVAGLDNRRVISFLGGPRSGEKKWYSQKPFPLPVATHDFVEPDKFADYRDSMRNSMGRGSMEHQYRKMSHENGGTDQIVTPGVSAMVESGAPAPWKEHGNCMLSLRQP